jgi:SAM-dependent methyltransferase
MKPITAVINRILSRAGLHVSRDSSFQGLISALELELKKNEHERLLRKSKERWSADEPDAGLTWGVSMSGENFAEFVLQHVALTDNSIVVEIGPGYGRILNALLSHRVRFRRYIGLEISPRRVNRLSKQFQDPRIEFYQADILAGVELNAIADLTISSAVFEHLYPDFSRAIEIISGFTRPGGAAIIDFVRDENDLDKSSSWFEKETTYIRMYSRNELRNLFEGGGFRINELQGISFGPDIDNREITRTVVLATKPQAAGPPIDSLKNPIRAPLDIRQFDFFVHNSPAPSHDSAIDPPVRRQFRSSFGGLWTDLDNAEAIVAGKVAIGDILPAEACLVVDWIRNGFVILPGAVSAAAIDAAMLDFEAAYDGNLGCKMSFWDSEVRYEEASRAHVRKLEAKLLGLHNVSETVQRVIFVDAVSRFLHILFERPALAFQSLGFYYGSQQHLHHDYAFVRVSSPLEFVASWIALEDITPGSGELEYYPGSHLLAPYLFADKHLWVEYDDPELRQVFLQNLNQRAREAGLSLQRFLPKKGDVFIWAAGLIHGGSPVTDANLTRKSLVTHYCPADQQPMFAYKGGRPKRKSICGHYVMADIWE